MEEIVLAISNGLWHMGPEHASREKNIVYGKLRYESSTLILYKELSSPSFQSLWVSESVSQASVREPFIYVLAEFVR